MSSTQEAYIQTLRQIKDAEDSAEKEINARKKEVEEEIRNMQIQIEKLIEASKDEGENLVIKSIEESRVKALAEADSIIKEAQIKAANISAQVNNQTIRKIIDILLRDLSEGTC
jgi:vacuolar-type H+-ATPase subunit H